MIVECSGCKLRYDLSGQGRGTRLRCRCGTMIEVAADQGHANTVQCTSCGGATASSESACSYCGNLLANLRCASCLALQPPHMDHCGRCGAGLHDVARPVSSADEPRDCPRCHVPLTQQMAGDTMIDHCDECLGLWIEHEALERLVDHHQTRLTRRNPPSQRVREEHTAGAKKRVVYLKCPECDGIMTRRNPAQRSGIIVDVCHAHGVWFDHDELAVMLAMVRDGRERIALVPSLEAQRRSIADARGDHIMANALQKQNLRRKRRVDLDVVGELPDILSLIDRLF